MTGILKRDGKLGVLLLQLSPAFSPRKHELSELEPLLVRLKNSSVAVEFRDRNWTTPAELRCEREIPARTSRVACRR